MDKKYLTVKDVAKLLGVTPLTLRNWDKKGKLIAHRNPINNYRVYKREDIENLVGEIEAPVVKKESHEKKVFSHTSTSSRKKESSSKRRLEIKSLRDDDY